MTELAERCANCFALLRGRGEFCHRCGARIGVDRPVDAPRRMVAHPLAPGRERAIQLAWAALFFGVLLASAIVVAYLPLTPTWASVWGITVSVAVTAVFCSMESDKIRSMLVLRNLGPIDLAQTLGVAAVLFLVLNVYFAFTASIGVATEDTLSGVTGLSRLGRLFMVGFAAPVIEEFAFRGFIQSRLERAFSPVEAIVIQGALFSVSHLLPWSFPSHFLMGVALGYLAHTTRSLYPPLALHMLWNAHVVAGLGFS